MIITKEQADQEIASWLDNKGVRPKKREAYKASIESLEDAISEGDLVLNEDFTLTQKLKQPTSGDVPITSLTYKARLTVGEVKKKMENVKPGDPDARIIALVSALTTQPKGVIEALDTDDYGIAQNIALFFV